MSIFFLLFLTYLKKLCNLTIHTMVIKSKAEPKFLVLPCFPSYLIIPNSTAVELPSRTECRLQSVCPIEYSSDSILVHKHLFLPLHPISFVQPQFLFSILTNSSFRLLFPLCQYCMPSMGKKQTKIVIFLQDIST